MGKAKKMLACCLVMALISGCWDNRELNDQAIQLAAGLDWTEDQTYIVSNQFARNPEAGQSDMKSQIGFYTEIAEGKTPMAALAAMQSKVTRIINRGQRRSLVIGDKLARRGFKDILDFILRNAESPMRVDLFIVKKGDASDLLKSSTPFGGQSLREYYKLHQANYGAVDVTFTDMIRMMNELSHSGNFMPAMEKVSKKGSEKIDDPKQAVYRFAGSAVLDNDAKLLGYLNLEETNNSLWIVNWPHRHLITVTTPDGTGTITIQLRGTKSKWKMKKNDIKNMQLNMSANITLVENTSNLDLLNTENLDAIKKELEQEIERQMKLLIRKFQHDLHIDAIGVGEYLYRNHPQHWRTVMDEWQNTFPAIDFSCSVRLKFTRFGLTGASGYLKKEEVKDPL